MTTYKCTACKREVEVEEITGDVVEVSLCESCIDAAEEAVKQESHDEGYQEGWQAGFDTAEEEKAGEEDTSIFLQNEDGKGRAEEDEEDERS